MQSAGSTSLTGRLNVAHDVMHPWNSARVLENWYAHPTGSTAPWSRQAGTFRSTALKRHRETFCDQCLTHVFAVDPQDAVAPPKIALVGPFRSWSASTCDPGDAAVPRGDKLSKAFASLYAQLPFSRTHGLELLRGIEADEANRRAVCEANCISVGHLEPLGGKRRGRGRLRCRAAKAERRVTVRHKLADANSQKHKQHG